MGLTTVLKNCELIAKTIPEAKILSVKNPIVKIKDIKLKELIKDKKVDADIITNFRNFWGYRPRIINTNRGRLDNLNYYVCNWEVYNKYGLIIDSGYIVDAYYVNDEYYTHLEKYDIG